MAEETSNIQKELEKASEQGKLKIGLNTTLRALKQGLATKVIYALNTPDKLKEELNYYSKLANIQAVEYKGNAKDLGVACKRTHNVLTAIIVKA